MFVEKSGSTNSILLTISLEIRMCTVLKALREVVSLHLSASSLSQRSRQYFITKLFIPCLCLFTFLSVQVMRVAGFDWFGSDLDSFFVNYETFFNVLSIVSMCTGSYVVM